MENSEVHSNISETLLDVFTYAFVESAPYSFFIPTRDKYTAVNLKNKVYHCLSCDASLEVCYKKNGVVYFSKERFEKQREMYAKRALDFHNEQALEEEREFTYHEEGYCTACVLKYLQETEDAQRLYNLCFELHTRDRQIVEEARRGMRGIVEEWLKSITESSQIIKYDLSSYTSLKNLICAVILQNLNPLKVCLQKYRQFIDDFSQEATKLLADLPPKWECYAARPLTIYESMSDELYHEYTVVFPEEGTPNRNFYVKKNIEKTRVVMFIEQSRINTVEELVMEAGFMDAWVDMLIDHVTAFKR